MEMITYSIELFDVAAGIGIALVFFSIYLAFERFYR